MADGSGLTLVMVLSGLFAFLKSNLDACVNHKSRCSNVRDTVLTTNELLDSHGPIDGRRMVARRSANWRPYLLGDRCDNMVLVMLARLLLVTGCALVRIR